MRPRLSTESVIPSVVMYNVYVREAGSLALKEEHILLILEGKAQRRLFGPKSE
jgi:hypothetical protein